MSTKNKIVGFLIAMAFATFALPASADKVYQLTMSSSSLAAGVPGQSVSMQINNISGDTGNSNSSSFKLNAPAGFTIQQVYTVSRGQTKNTVAVGGGYTATIQVLNDGSAVWVSSIQTPLKPFGPALKLNNMTVDVSCSPDRTGAWVLPGVWTGSGFSGQTFTLNTTQYPQYPSITKTAVSGACANYTITPTTTAAVNSGGGSVSLSFNNTSPAGGASISSLSIKAPTNFTITGGSAPSGWVVTPSGSTVTVTGGPAVAPGSSLALTLIVTTPNCDAAGAAPWSNAQVSTGATPTTGTQFAGPGTYPSTAITALPCSATFVNQPATTFTGYTITDTAYSNPNNNNPARAPLPVTVNLVINGVPAAEGTAVSLSVDTHVTGTCALSSYTATTVGGVATFSNLSGAAGTGCTLGASGGGVSSTTDSSSFDLIGPAGTLACDGSPASQASSTPTTPPLDPRSKVPPPSDGQTGWALVRGQDVGGGCGNVLIPYTFSCDANRNCQFTEDSLGQHPSIEYVVLWPAVAVGSDPTADKQPCVSWGVANPDPGGDPTVCGGDYVPGLACTTDNVDGGAAVMPDIPNLPPFSGFTGSDHPQYQIGQKAKVCIAQHGFTSGTGAAAGSVVYWTKIIDQSDTGIRLP